MRKKRFWFAMLPVAALCAALVMLLLPSAGWAQGKSERAHERVIEVQERHTERLLGIEGVVGTAAGPEAVIVLVKNSKAAKKVPKELDGVPVNVKISGEIRALEATDRYDRPVPIGVSTGNEGEASAGTIACRVTDGVDVYALSNNHVFALENNAPMGSRILQPGVYDGGTTEDVIGTLHAFEPIVFSPSSRTRNKIDAAIALCTTGTLGEATLTGGYGTPESEIVSAEVGQQVMKYGRTTEMTYGQVTGVNATLKVGYDSGTARFVNQVIVQSSSPFIGAGDSGSLLVTDPGKNPVGLLFAGNDDGTFAVANRIDLVLDRFGVTVDDGAVAGTDIAVTEVSAPSPVVLGTTVDVKVTVKNVGNQDVTIDINVTLTDETDAAVIGTQTIGGLDAGASTVLTFPWTTTGATTDHTLTAEQDYVDDNAGNDTKSTTVTVTEEPVGATMHVDSIDMSPGSRAAGPNTFVWAIATVTIVDASGVPVPVEGATVNGHWEGATTGSDSGTTDADGEVPLKSDSVKNPPAETTFTFFVDSVAKDGWTYDSGANVETSDSIITP